MDRLSVPGHRAGHPAARLVTSIPNVFSSFKWGWLPLGPLITQRFDAAAAIAAVKVPVLVVHGSEDQRIAPSLGRALYERAVQPKRFVLAEGGSHQNTHSLVQDPYRQALVYLFGPTPKP